MSAAEFERSNSAELSSPLRKIGRPSEVAPRSSDGPAAGLLRAAPAFGARRADARRQLCARVHR
jgi:hypothetical protein